MEGNWIAHVLALPGCFSTGRDPTEALDGVPSAVQSYQMWCAAHRMECPAPDGPPAGEENVRAWISEGDYEVNAFFAADRPALREEELPRFVALLSLTRADLLASVEGLTADQLQVTFPGERWPITGVLRHVGGAEWWYLDRLGLAFPKEEVPEAPFERLTKVRDHFLAQLPALRSYEGIVTREGEVWSARKVLRRALWHERDHTGHIGKLREILGK